MADKVPRVARHLQSAWARVQHLWRLTARTVDRPMDADQWLELIADPRPIYGSVSWGLALGDYCVDARRARRSALGTLVSAWRDQGDDDAAELLSALLVRWLDVMEASKHFDFMVTYPDSMLSGPPGGTAGLLARSASASPVPWLSQCWVLRSARSWTPESLRLVEESAEAHVGVHAAVWGKRLLFVEEGPTPISCSTPWIHRLLGAGASRVGLLAMCTSTGDEHER